MLLRVHFYAPFPPTTTQTVFIRIWKSIHSDQLLMVYSSSLSRCSKVVPCLPMTCHQPVSPGWMRRKEDVFEVNSHTKRSARLPILRGAHVEAHPPTKNRVSKPSMIGSERGNPAA